MLIQENNSCIIKFCYEGEVVTLRVQGHTVKELFDNKELFTALQNEEIARIKASKEKAPSGA